MIEKKSKETQKIKKQKLIIIGNGFDLAHGLKTSYADFFVNYLQNKINELYIEIDDTITNNETIKFQIECKAEKPIKKNPIVISKIKNIVSKLEKKPDELFTYIFNPHNSGLILEEDRANSFQSIDKIEKNYMRIESSTTNFAKELLKSVKKTKWVDIEELYYQELKRILSNYYNKLKDHKGDKGKFKTEQIIKPVEKLNNQMSFLRKELKKYLLKINDDIIEFDKMDNLLFKNEISKNDQIIYHLLNFNYTDTLLKYTEKYTDNNIVKSRINHIHGELNNDDNPIIFGYGDEKDDDHKGLEKLNINEVFKHFKSFGYFRSNNYKNLLKFINSDKFEVSIIGHSCGLSDRTMLSTIFEHKYCESIRIYYYQKEIDSIDESDYIDKTYSIYRLFDNKAEMRDKIISFDEQDRIPQHDD